MNLCEFCVPRSMQVFKIRVDLIKLTFLHAKAIVFSTICNIHSYKVEPFCVCLLLWMLWNSSFRDFIGKSIMYAYIVLYGIINENISQLRQNQLRLLSNVFMKISIASKRKWKHKRDARQQLKKQKRTRARVKDERKSKYMNWFLVAFSLDNAYD